MKKAGIISTALLIAACAMWRLPPAPSSQPDGYAPMMPGMGPGGITWAAGSFDSLGEQIYFAGLGQNGRQVPYSGGPSWGMMMAGYLACASCHGPDARGGLHAMHMQAMDAPDIRWSALESEEHEEHGDEGDHGAPYDLSTFRLAVVEGKHPDGDPISQDMPRWELADSELEQLATYLQTLP